MESSPEVTMVVANQVQLANAEAAYSSVGHAAQLYRMPRVLSALSADEHSAVKWSYSNRLVPQERTARKFYEVLRGLVGEFDCPSCLRREVDELDHYLPKSKFGYLAITPLNLVPICSRCNKKKKAFVATRAEDQPLHPYFDDLGDFDWLIADLRETVGAPLTFTIASPRRWSATLASRVVAQFVRLDLGKLYSKQATRFLGDIRLMLTERLARGGGAAVRRSLQEYQRSWASGGFEPWNVAALRTWSASDWFCEGGFGPLILAPDDAPRATSAVTGGPA